MCLQVKQSILKTETDELNENRTFTKHTYSSLHGIFAYKNPLTRIRKHMDGSLIMHLSK